jgi:hypoxanthine phosphoribosyltransferase
VTLTTLYSEEQIAARIAVMAREIAKAPLKPDFACAILVGAFVFTADLLRALAREGLSLPVEFLWLRSYGKNRTGAAEVSALVAPSENVRAKTVLLIDGVLDKGATIVKARELLLERGAAAVITAVIVDKDRPDALVKADHAGFTGTQGFLVGYGMDDAGNDRGLPFIGKVED